MEPIVYYADTAAETNDTVTAFVTAGRSNTATLRKSAAAYARQSALDVIDTDAFAAAV